MEFREEKKVLERSAKHRLHLRRGQKEKKMEKRQSDSQSNNNKKKPTRESSNDWSDENVHHEKQKPDVENLQRMYNN